MEAQPNEPVMEFTMPLEHLSDEELNQNIKNVLHARANLLNVYEMFIQERLRRVGSIALDPWSIRDRYNDRHVRGEE